MAQLGSLVIQMTSNDPVALSIKNKLDELLFDQSMSTNGLHEQQEAMIPWLYQSVSSYIEENKKLFEPHIVSIGPYHRDGGGLEQMEKHKVLCISKLLSKNTNVTLDKYIEVLRQLEPDARRCYCEKIEMDSDQFVEMLMHDACFIIQLVVNWKFPDGDNNSDINEYLPLIKNDILMLENQIPCFVLQRVFELCSSIDDSHSSNSLSNFDSMSQDSDLEKSLLLPYLLLKFLQHENENLPLPDTDQGFDHLLDFFHCCKTSQKHYSKPRKNLLPFKLMRPKKEFPLISSSIKKSNMHRYLQMIVNRELQMVPCATELENAGVTFKKAESNRGFAVNFSHGELKIPYILVEEETIPQLMNLIAFEHCSGQKEKPLTSYVVLMDCIVKTPRDVQILQQHEIIENKMADENAACQFFNQLRYCPYLDYKEHQMAELFKNVNRYCDSRWQRYKEKLYRDYFSNPWSIIPFILKHMLSFLSILQTLYTVLSYYRS